jgi:hypothetical protein
MAEGRMAKGKQIKRSIADLTRTADVDAVAAQGVKGGFASTPKAMPGDPTDTVKVPVPGKPIPIPYPAK